MAEVCHTGFGFIFALSAKALRPKQVLPVITCHFKKRLRAHSGEMLLDVALQLERGIFACLYGKSGAGKTSVLRMLAGLMQPDTGYLEVGGQVWLDTRNGINLRPQKRRLGFVFQDYALFPNMSVRENLHFALNRGQDKRIVEELMDIVGLTELQDQKPDRLSGGQKQRVALARALVQRPPLLLLDEPLSALDCEMRLKLQQYILQLHREYGLTSILVSHDLLEVFRMAERVFIMHEGSIIASGQPQELLAEQMKTYLKGVKL